MGSFVSDQMDRVNMMDEDEDFIPFLGSPTPPRTPEEQAARLAHVRRQVERIKAKRRQPASEMGEATKEPNETTRAAIAEAEEIRTARRSRSAT